MSVELTAAVIIGSGVLYVTITGAWAHRRATKALIIERRRRYIVRVEPELMDKMPAEWARQAADEVTER